MDNACGLFAFVIPFPYLRMYARAVTSNKFVRNGSEFTTYNGRYTDDVKTV
jgi:hypothetical protein